MQANKLKDISQSVSQSMSSLFYLMWCLDSDLAEHPLVLEDLP